MCLPRYARQFYADRVTDPIVSLDADRLSVEPGGQVSVTIKITNPGTIVEGYRIEVVGDGVSGWGEALPPEISVYPKQDSTAVVVFSPPGGTGAPGGTWPFGIRVRSTEDADASAVAEGDLEIGKVFGLQAKLVPVNSAGRWRGRHVIELSNWGNSPARLKLSATNPDEALAFMIRPDLVELPLGGTATAMVWVRTKKPFLRGSPVRIPFSVVGEPDGAAPQQGPALPYGGTPDRPSVDGALNQKPIISKGAVTIAVLALLAVAGGVAWALTRPPPAQATFQELGPPDPPSGVKVEPMGSGSVRVAWSPVPNVEKYTVVEVLPDGSQLNSVDVAASDNAKTVGDLAPAASVCFKVRAQRGDLPGPFSDQACGKTADAQPTASATPTGAPSSAPPSGATGNPSGPGSQASSGGSDVAPPPPPPDGGPTTPGGASSSAPPSTGSSTGSDTVGADTTANPSFKGKYFAVAYWPTEGTIYDPAVKLAKLRALDQRGGLAKNTVYPGVGIPIQRESWLLYLGPFDTVADANAACSTIRQVHPDCLATQLEP